MMTIDNCSLVFVMAVFFNVVVICDDQHPKLKDDPCIQADTLVNEAEKLIDDQDRKLRAPQMFRDASVLCPEKAGEINKKAMLYDIEMFSRYPDDSYVLLNLGDFSQYREKRIRKKLEKILLNDFNNNPESILNESDIFMFYYPTNLTLLELREPDKARTYLEGYMKENENEYFESMLFYHWIGRAHTYLAFNEKDKAFAELEKLRSLEKPDFYNYKADLKAAEFIERIENSDKAFAWDEFAPFHIEQEIMYFFGRAELFDALGRLEECVEEYLNAVKYMEQHISEERELMKRLCLVSPIYDGATILTRAGIYVKMGQYLEEKGLKERATVCYEKALKLIPEEFAVEDSALKYFKRQIKESIEKLNNPQTVEKEWMKM